MSRASLKTYPIVEHGELHRKKLGDALFGQLQDFVCAFDDQATPDDPDAPRRQPIFTLRGSDRIQVHNWVGAIALPAGIIEIVPKVGSGKVEDGRAVVRNMLRALGDAHPEARFLNRIGRSVAKALPLFDQFLAAFLDALAHVIRRGLRRCYCERQENLRCFRGRLLLARDLRANRGLHHRNFMAYDSYELDHPANRLLRAALDRALAIITNPKQCHRAIELRHRAIELRFHLADVRPSAHPAADFRQLVIDRMMQHYSDALAWASILLDHRSPLGDAAPEVSVPAVLFPMEQMFERYVGALLARDENISNLQSKPTKHLLRSNEAETCCRMEPDFQFTLTNQQDATGQKDGTGQKGRTEQEAIGDAKWKRFKGAPSTPDAYQLFAYGHAFLGGSGDLYLFYPKTNGLSKAKSWDYVPGQTSTNGSTTYKLHLHACPVMLPTGRKDAGNIIFPENPKSGATEHPRAVARG